MNASEEWKRLNRAVNVKHYIGPNAHQCIEDAINGKPKAEKAKTKTITTKSDPKPKSKVAKTED